MSQFVDVLEEMRAHYKSSVGQASPRRYAASQQLAAYFTAAQASSVKLSAQENDLLKGLQIDAQASGQEEASGIETGIVGATEALKSAGASPTSVEEFKKKMEEQRKKAKEDSNARIDKIFDTAIKIGLEHPDLQQPIVVLIDKIGNFFNDLFNKIADFIVGVVRDVVAWLKNAWDSIKSTFNGITGWISGWF
ncbi:MULTISPECIES: hypothetical protein [Burkholderia]|uniref:hypothetical protein n=1 Tax=Burkholderia TaxID=32008 RepID=UPI00075F529F|nr:MULTISPECIES: hypothetical protein [Burkholderia]AOJ71266.1 hypothetical protein WS78_20625 [Burkholderia savannae]AOK49663.1 hypothetical protein WT60_22430 [Burkholderia sp. MSMB617WGS]KVG48666.1 hypothetical protein WS77_02725 [Burkholderia sp. MSMB0265]KVG86123.1 hypothetical protein WS81_29395 [Burkholderia sp. MSMB2040]KVG90405.1 hypothetical protein WS82_16860 [Burkholderia sp. MSMB2041]